MFQINNSDLLYKKMGLIGVLKIVSYIADTNNVSLPPLSHVMCLSNSTHTYIIFKLMTYTCDVVVTTVIIFLSSVLII